jgi:hypothetical protein
MLRCCCNVVLSCSAFGWLAYEYIPDTGYADSVIMANISRSASPINYQATIPTADI